MTRFKHILTVRFLVDKQRVSASKAKSGCLRKLWLLLCFAWIPIPMYFSA